MVGRHDEGPQQGWGLLGPHKTQPQFQHQSDGHNLLKIIITAGPMNKRNSGSKGRQELLCCRAVMYPEGTEWYMGKARAAGVPEAGLWLTYKG